MSKEKLSKAANTLLRWLSSRWFFWGIIGFFMCEALWLALSFRYPMLFDEGYHFGLIKVFAHHSWPFFSQPPEYDVYRDIGREGSYLFHYILSYPYRLFGLFTTGSTQQIIFLRLLNIGLFAYGLVIYDKLFKRLGIKQIFINIGLLFFVLLPVVPFLAATINYDNLLFLLTAAFLVVSLDVAMAAKPRAMSYVWLLILALAASLVKFTFLPIFIPAAIFIAMSILRNKPKKFMVGFTKSLRTAKRSTLIAAVMLMVVLGAWFTQIYVQNVVRYGNYRPTCPKTLTLQRCLASPIIQRNTALAATRDQRQLQPPTTFAFEWTEAMFTLLSVTGVHGSAGIVAHTHMPISSLVLFGLMVLGTVAIIYTWRDNFANKKYYFLLTVFLFYAASLFLQNLSSYMRYHTMVAVQPRYMLAFIPIIAVMMSVGLNRMVSISRTYKVLALLVVFVLYLNFSGITMHIMRSDESWYWQNAAVKSTNSTAKKVLNKIVIERF